MMSLRVIDSSFGSIRMMIRLSLSVPNVCPPPHSAVTVRLVRPYKYCSGPCERGARSRPESRQGCSMIFESIPLNTLGVRSRQEPDHPGRSCNSCAGRHRPDGGEADGGNRLTGVPRVRRGGEPPRRVRRLRHETVRSTEEPRGGRRVVAQGRFGRRVSRLARDPVRGRPRRSAAEVARRGGHGGPGGGRRGGGGPGGGNSQNPPLTDVPPQGPWVWREGAPRRPPS